MADPFDPYHRWLGIPPKDQPPNHYRLLGLELFEGDADVIQSAADQRMAHLRTFQTGKHGKLSQTLLNEVAAAKICLLRPRKRAAYDKLLRQQLQPKPVAAPKPQAEEPADSQLADFVAQADRDMPAVRSQVAARRKTPKLGLLLGAVAVAGVVVLGLILRGALSTAETALVLDWPEDQRKEATLKIDGEPFVVVSSGPLRHGCRPGKHRIRAARPGFEPFVETVTLEEGETKTVRPVWQKAAEKGPTPPAPPLAGADKTPPDKPAETPSDGTTSVAGPPTPPVEPGDGSPQEKPGEEPPKVAVEPGPGEPKEPPPVEQERLPVPSADAQKVVAGQLEDLYKLSAAKTPQQKLQMAGELFDLGKKAKHNATERFVLLRKAGELARDGGDAALMLEAIEAIGADFDVDVLEAKQKFLAKFAQAATNSQRIGSLVENSLPLVDDGLAEGRYELAFEIIDTAYGACTRSAGKEHRKQVYDRRNEVQRVYQAWKKFQDALAALKTAPDDAHANLIVGQWYCFKQADWEQGLPHLAKGSDEGLKAVAQQELNSPPADASAQIKLADAWWELAQMARGETKDALLLHAGTWYEKAEPNVISSLLKAKLTKRLEEIDKVERRGLEVARARPHPGKRAPRRKTPTHWDPVTAKLLRTLEGHTSWVRSAAFSRDGSTLVSGSDDKTVRLWDPAEGKLRELLPPLKDQVWGVAVSPDGSLVAAASKDHTISLWDTAKREFRAVLTGHTAEVFSVDISPNGALLASSSQDQTVKLWETATGRLRATLQGHTAEVRWVTFSPDGSLLASAGGHDSTLRVWDVASGVTRGILKGHGGHVRSVTFSPDGLLLASASHDTTARVWSMATGRELSKLGGFGGAVNQAAFHPDGSVLAIASDDKTVRIWDARTGQVVRTITFETPVLCLAFSPGGSILAVGDQNTVKLWGNDRGKSKTPADAQPAKTATPSGARKADTTRRRDLVTRRIDFRSPKAIGVFVLKNPTAVGWDAKQRRMLIGRDGDNEGRAIYGEYFRSISSVTVRGGIVPPSHQNFRMSVGPIDIIFNWESGDGNLFHIRGVQTTTSPPALTPGKTHEIRIVQQGEKAVVSVDGKQLYSTTATLEGTISVYPAYGSTISVEQILMEGIPDPTRAVTAP